MLTRLFEDQALWFSAPALFGTGVFVLRMGLMLLGGGDGHDGGHAIDVGDAGDAGDVHDVHFGGDGDGADGHDSEGAFDVLSFQSVAAFMAGFGWGGVGAHLGLGWTPTAAGAVGVASGVAMVWLLGLLLKGVHDLQTSGTLRMEAAIGSTADVYATIPARGQGRGQVRVVVKDRMRIVDAVSDDQPLPRSSRVRVLAVNDDRSLTVTAA